MPTTSFVPADGLVREAACMAGVESVRSMAHGGQEAFGETSGLDQGARATPAFSCTRADGAGTWDEPKEARQARQPRPGALEGAAAAVHRAPLLQELRPGAARDHHIDRGAGSGAACKEGGAQGSEAPGRTGKNRHSFSRRRAMSEYQYYEFQAIDRPLTAREVDELRSYSSRARITATSFVNEYSWGNFKGNEDAWMEKYFDAFLYLANWGTHIVKLRLPARLLERDIADQYCGESASVREKNGNIILTFGSEDEDGDELVEGEGELSSLISVRSELARGDLRALYLGWLLCVQNGELDDDEIEPLIPAGLGQLSASLSGFADFLRIDSDLIDAAAAASPPLIEIEPRPEEIREWLAKLPVADKDDVLAQLMAGNTAAPGTELVQSMRRER